MAKTAFSDVLIRSLPLPQRGQKKYWDKSLPSFGIRVSQGGSKTFVLNRDNNLITIGRFGVLKLAEARTEAKKLLAEFTLGKVRPQSLTFAEAVQLYLEDKGKSRRGRTVRDYKRLLGRLNFNGQLSDLTHDDVSRKLAKFTAPQEYNHLLVAFRVFENWCIKRRYITHAFTAGLSQHATRSRTRVLTDAEVKLIWHASDSEDLPAPFRTIVKLLILTGQRRSEIGALQTSWINDNTIALPPSLTKNRREHVFPLGTMAASLCASATATPQVGLLFPARGKEMQPFNGWSKSKASLDAASGVEDWTLHDLRRTYATTMAKLGVPIHIIERLLNHVSGSFAGIVSVYNRNQYLPEMREAVLKYESHLKPLLTIN